MTQNIASRRIRSAMAIALASLTLASAAVHAAPYRGEQIPMTTRYADQTGNLSDFTVDQPERYAPGRRFVFTVRGEPRAKVTVQMQAAGVNKTLALAETDRGVYEGAYTLRSNDDFTRPTFRAKLVKGRMLSTAVVAPDERALRRMARQEERRERQEQRAGYRDDYRADQRVICQSCGVLESVQIIDERSDNSALGVIGGAVVGGLLGNQVGGGSGRDLATIAGAIGGGYAGNEIARNQGGAQRLYLLTIRMDNGDLVRLRTPQNPNLSTGQRVRVNNNTVSPDYSR